MTLTATLHLKRAFIATVAAPAQFVAAGTAGRGDSKTQEGEFRIYANDVTKLIVGAGATRQLAITFRALTPAQLTLLKSMVGDTCLFRDTYGRGVYGSFLVTNEVDLIGSGVANSTLLTDVTITFQETTYDEAV